MTSETIATCDLRRRGSTPLELLGSSGDVLMVARYHTSEEVDLETMWREEWLTLPRWEGPHPTELEGLGGWPA